MQVRSVASRGGFMGEVLVVVGFVVLGALLVDRTLRAQHQTTIRTDRLGFDRQH